MADLSLSSGGGSVNYSPISQGGSDTNYGSPTAPGFDGYHTTVGMTPASDPFFDSKFFSENLNAANPYNKTFTQYIVGSQYNLVGYDGFGMPIFRLQQYSYAVYPTNPAYTDFENKATTAQNTYFSQQQIEFNKANDKAAADLTASYGNVRDSSIQTKIQTLADLKAQITELKYQDDITKYLNRVGDTDNSKQIAELEKQAAALDTDVSRNVLEYWQQQELIRKQSREDFTYRFNYLSDPYFGKYNEIFPSFIADSAQPDMKNFASLIYSGDMSDWMAGGVMYDSPRAGNILFNITGNLNTTVFMGLENKNSTPDMQAAFANAEVFKSFGALAGDINFSVLNFGS